MPKIRPRSHASNSSPSFSSKCDKQINRSPNDWTAVWRQCWAHSSDMADALGHFTKLSPVQPIWAGSLGYRKKRKVSGKPTITVPHGQVALLFTYICTWLQKFYLADVFWMWWENQQQGNQQTMTSPNPQTRHSSTYHPPQSPNVSWLCHMPSHLMWHVCYVQYHSEGPCLSGTVLLSLSKYLIDVCLQTIPALG